MPAEPPVLVLCNPFSGRRESRERALEIVRGLAERGVPAELRDTDPGRHVLADATPERFRALVVVGGDGSFHAAVNELCAPGALELPIAFVGTGTINVLSRELGLPAAPADVVRLVLAGKVARLPLLAANGRRFVLFAEAGWLGGVVARVNRWRRSVGRHGRLEFARFGLAGLVSSWGAPLTVRVRTAQGEERSGRFANVLATRARNYGETLRLPLCDAGCAPLAAQTFTFLGERTRTPAGHALYLAAGGVGRMEALGSRRIERCLAREVLVEGPTATGVHLDAESEGTAMRLPLLVRAAGVALPVLVP